MSRDNAVTSSRARRLRRRSFRIMASADASESFDSNSDDSVALSTMSFSFEEENEEEEDGGSIGEQVAAEYGANPHIYEPRAPRRQEAEADLTA